MNREDIIRMAREAHRQLVTQDYPGHAGQLDPWTMRLLERFADLVAAHEREACAKLAEDHKHDCYEGDLDWYEAGRIADAIRARGQA